MRRKGEEVEVRRRKKEKKREEDALKVSENRDCLSNFFLFLFFSLSLSLSPACTSPRMTVVCVDVTDVWDEEGEGC